ncbi:MAG: nucleotide-binding protein [Cyanobacteria bacterium J06631_6]
MSKIYYHVFVETTDEYSIGWGNEQIFQANETSLNRVVDNVLIPYLCQETIRIKGRLLQPHQIRKILVKQSFKKAEEIAKEKSKNIFPISTFAPYDPKEMIKWDNFMKDITDDAFNTADNKLKLDSNFITNKTNKMQLDKNKVFIVHGHDELLKTQTARMIRELGLEAIILHEQASSGKTIIEKIEEYTNVGFAIILYTPCDVGAKKGNESNLSERARQNVIWEHGYLTGKLGRKNVCALVKGNIEKPSDISGILYISVDDAGKWQYDVGKELRQSGYSVDLNDI